MATTPAVRKGTIPTAKHISGLKALQVPETQRSAKGAKIVDKKIHRPLPSGISDVRIRVSEPDFEEAL
jgi:hypothetical protein